ncbi:MAG: hypothetical protein IKH61_14380, partial [Bacteroidales bacterium]|nr:hypothetical protein [Bacteroidales bacterium]
FILSQDQTLRCTIVFSFLSVLNLGFRLDVVLFGVPLLKVPFPDGAPAPPVLCWPQTFKELLSPSVRLSSVPSPSESGCKSTGFPITRNGFFQLFFIFHVSRWMSIRKI